MAAENGWATDVEPAMFYMKLAFVVSQDQAIAKPQVSPDTTLYLQSIVHRVCPGAWPLPAVVYHG